MTDEEKSPGWDAIDAALKPIYKDEKPQHYGTAVPYALGGPDPIHGISAYPRSNPDHWHIVTYGFTELWAKESDDKETSGYGFELTFRIARAKSEEKPPVWALNMMQNLGRYVFSTGNVFGVGHHMPLNGPICVGSDTLIHAVLFGADPELGEFTSENGKARFIQIVGITMDELALAMEWNTESMLREMRALHPLLVTTLDRSSILKDRATEQRLRALADAEGSSMEYSGLDEKGRFIPGRPLVWELGALWIENLKKGLKGRTLHERPYALVGSQREVQLLPGKKSAAFLAENVLTLTLTPGLARAMMASLQPKRGEYSWPELPGFVLRVVPTEVKGQKGGIDSVVG